MAILSVDEIRGRKSTQDALWRRTYTRKYRVVTDDPLVDAKTVRTAAGLPSVGNSYSANGVHDYGSFVNQVSAEEESEDGKSWVVTVEYGPYDPTTFPQNPIDWPVKIRFTTNKLERVIWADQAGNAILNSAKDPFKDPITIDDSRSVITVTRNELVSTFDLTLADLYKDKVNNGTWNGFLTKVVKCSDITTGDPQIYASDTSGAILYYVVTYTFEINRDTWVKSILDQGFFELDSSSPPKRKQILDLNGQPATEAMPLDGSGHALASNGTPVFMTYDVYPSTDFSVFNIDFSKAMGRS